MKKIISTNSIDSLTIKTGSSNDYKNDLHFRNQLKNSISRFLNTTLLDSTQDSNEMKNLLEIFSLTTKLTQSIYDEINEKIPKTDGYIKLDIHHKDSFYYIKISDPDNPNNHLIEFIIFLNPKIIGEYVDPYDTTDHELQEFSKIISNKPDLHKVFIFLKELTDMEMEKVKSSSLSMNKPNSSTIAPIIISSYKRDNVIGQGRDGRIFWKYIFKLAITKSNHN